MEPIAFGPQYLRGLHVIYTSTAVQIQLSHSETSYVACTHTPYADSSTAAAVLSLNIRNITRPYERLYSYNCIHTNYTVLVRHLAGSLK